MKQIKKVLSILKPLSEGLCNLVEEETAIRKKFIVIEDFEPLIDAIEMKYLSESTLADESDEEILNNSINSEECIDDRFSNFKVNKETIEVDYNLTTLNIKNFLKLNFEKIKKLNYDYPKLKNKDIEKIVDMESLWKNFSTVKDFLENSAYAQGNSRNLLPTFTKNVVKLETLGKRAIKEIDSQLAATITNAANKNIIEESIYREDIKKLKSMNSSLVSIKSIEPKYSKINNKKLKLDFSKENKDFIISSPLADSPLRSELQYENDNEAPSFSCLSSRGSRNSGSLNFDYLEEGREGIQLNSSNDSGGTIEKNNQSNKCRLNNWLDTKISEVLNLEVSRDSDIEMKGE